jgi:hypothetical protein
MLRLFSCVCLLVLCWQGNVFANLALTKEKWVQEALKLQREIDLYAPLNEATFIGTHNSYNSKSYALRILRYIDPNQLLSINDQLNAGVRSLEFDVHWTRNEYLSKDMLLCHAPASHIGC